MFSNFVIIALGFFGLAEADGMFDFKSIKDEVLAPDGSILHCKSGTENFVECFSPLVQFINKEKSTYLQTANLEDGVGQAAVGQYIYRGALGRVITKADGCGCSDFTKLVPAYLLTKPGSADYLLASDPGEIETHKQSGYLEKRIDFYCSPEPDQCGATQPLYRHNSPSGILHSTAYTTNEKQHSVWDASGWKFDGIVCYIWPKQFNAHNFAGQN